VAAFIFFSARFAAFPAWTDRLLAMTRHPLVCFSADPVSVAAARSSRRSITPGVSRGVRPSGHVNLLQVASWRFRRTEFAGLRSPWAVLILLPLFLLFLFLHLLLLAFFLVFLATFISHACSFFAILTRNGEWVLRW
jgi:hypothetical protein